RGPGGRSGAVATGARTRAGVLLPDPGAGDRLGGVKFDSIPALAPLGRECCRTRKSVKDVVITFCKGCGGTSHLQAYQKCRVMNSPLRAGFGGRSLTTGCLPTD